MFPVIFKIGPLTLHTYGLMVAVGFLVSFQLVRRGFFQKKIPLDYVDQMVLIMVLAGLFGARLLYFVAVDEGSFQSKFFNFVKVWEGGLVYYGAFLGGLAGLVYFCLKKDLPILKVTDICVGPLLLAQAFGRVGCFAAGCCYGRPTDSFLGVTFTHIDSLAPTYVSLHPTQLYSSFGLLLLFVALILIGKANPPRGTVSGFYLVGYGAFRFLIEILRNDFRGTVLLSLHPSQWISMVMIVDLNCFFL